MSSEFTYYNAETAPEESKALVEQSLKDFGTLPNLHAILAEAPATQDLNIVKGSEL